MHVGDTLGSTIQILLWTHAMMQCSAVELVLKAEDKKPTLFSTFTTHDMQLRRFGSCIGS